jgi:hypothetical protein
VVALEQRLRTPLVAGGTKPLANVMGHIGEGGDQALDILDCLLMLSASWRWVNARTAWESLDEMLATGGSAWKVGYDPDGRPCLQRRVDETSEMAAKAAMSKPGNAASHLRAAWHKVYGRSPDASAAYREAVRAIEAAAKPVVTPNDSIATLGKMITAMRDKPSKWTTELGSVTVVADMMGELWTSQLDRHGTDDESVPLSVSAAQAEAALHLAVTLVQWFQGGAVRR